MVKIDKNIYLLGLVSLLTDVSSEMIFPLVPIFLTTILGVPVALVGLIEGVAEATADILKMISGIYSDKIGKRMPFVIAGYGLSTIVKPIFAISMVWQHVFAARVLDRVGKGIRVSARDAIVADYTDEKNRGAAFGIRKMMDSMGATIGPLIAFFLLPYLLLTHAPADAYRLIFAVAVIPAALSVAILFFVKEKEDSERRPGWKLDISGFSRALKNNLIISFFFSLGTFSYAFFILRAQDSGMSILMIPLVYMFYNFIYSLAAVPSGLLADRVGRRRVIFIGYFVFALTAFGFGMASSDLQIWILFALYGIFMAIIETVQRTYISDHAPKELRGTALGFYQGSVGLAALPSSIIAGLLWEVKIQGIRATFLYGGTIALVAIVLFYVFVRDGEKK